MTHKFYYGSIDLLERQLPRLLKCFNVKWLLSKIFGTDCVDLKFDKTLSKMICYRNR